MKKDFTIGDIQKIFRLESNKRYALFNAEEKELIPKANRKSRGTTKVRVWDISQLPSIGEHFGFLKKPKEQVIICMYTPKGGVLKTTFGFNLARALALNNIKVLIIGLDLAQSSITGYALPATNLESLDDLETEDLGLYHYFFEKVPLSQVIKKSPLPTLDVIPETPDLNILEKKLRSEVNRREYYLKEKLIKELKNYDVILFDNGPSWNSLVANALTAANNVVSPMGCDIEAFKAIDKNLSMIFEFQEDMGIEWNNFIQVPTLLEPAKLSQQIYGTYLTKYSKTIVESPIRRSIKGQEARTFHLSIFEYDPTSSLADDYYKAIVETWKRITS